MRQLISILLVMLVVGMCGCKKSSTTVEEITSVELDSTVKINRNIMGITLGSTDIDSAILILKEKGYKAVYDKEDNNYDVYGRNLYRSISYEDVNWDHLTLGVDSNKTVNFIYFRVGGDYDLFRHGFTSVGLENLDPLEQLITSLTNQYEPILQKKEVFDEYSHISHYTDRVINLNLSVIASDSCYESVNLSYRIDLD